MGCLLVALPLLPLGAPAGAADQPFTVAVTPTADLTDGQAITVTVKTTPDHIVNNVVMQVCRSGVQYGTSTSSEPNGDFDTGGANCPAKPITTSADAKLVDTTARANAPTAAGSVSKYRVGVGATAWNDLVHANAPQTLTCDPDNPCSLVVEVRHGVTGALAWTPVVIDLHYRDDDPVAGCGGPADGVLLASGSDRMKDSWIKWTLDECHQPDRQGGATRTVFNGEGDAVSSFSKGKVDLAYTAAGYGNEVGLLSAADAADPRPSIAVPVALDAAVLAVAGGHPTATGVKVPYQDIRLLPAEVAALFSGGTSAISPYYPAIFARNPELNENFFDSGTSTTGINIAAPAGAETTSWVFTDHLKQTVPNIWTVPDNPGTFGTDAGKARGASVSIAVAQPSFAQVLTTLSGRPPLANANAKLALSKSTQGGMWVLTDLETASALEMTPVKVANDAGEFVPVTPETVAAGVGSMKQTDNGLLLPNPHAVDKVGGVTPYNMAFVEYALVPAEPLLSATCVTRPSSQALLTDWLTYLTGAGQAVLPAGMVPLTPELKQQAASQIQLVGKADVTGDCAGKVVAAGATTSTTAPATTTTSTTAAVAASTTGGTTAGTTGATETPTASSPRRSSSGSGRSTASTPAPVSSPVATSTGGDEVAIQSVPAFAGRRSIGWTGTLLALMGITALSGVAALIASGRSPGDLNRWLRSGSGPT